MNTNIKEEFLKLISSWQGLLKESNMETTTILCGKDISDPEQCTEIIVDVNKTPEEIYDTYYKDGVLKAAKE